MNPVSSTGDGGTAVSREELNVALDTLKTSMTTEVERDAGGHRIAGMQNGQRGKCSDA